MEHRIVVDANKRTFGLNLRDLLHYRDLFFILAYRDFRVRYAQTFLGLTWAFLQPLMSLAIFTIVFGYFIKVETSGVAYPVFALCGMAPWIYFSFVMHQSGNSVIGAQEMIKKIYFPRLVIPLSKAVVGLVDFAVALLLLSILLIFYKVKISATIFFLPFFILLTVTSALAAGIWLSALTIRYRDFQHVTPFLVQLGLYITPIAYPSETIMRSLPEWVNFLYYMNPMAGIVEGFRWSILGSDYPNPWSYLSFAVVLVLFISGLFYFKRIERIMADIV